MAEREVMRRSGIASSSASLLYHDGKALLCPKPQRVAFSPHFIHHDPFRPFRSRSSFDRQPLEGSDEGEVRCEIMEILLNKSGGCGGMREDLNYGSYPASFCGSPPARDSNPLVNDIEFIQRSHLHSPFGMTPTQAKPLGRAAFRSTPVIRIEGFDCAGRDSKFC